MLIDSNAVLLDNKAITSSTVNGDAVGLTSLFKPGRAEPIHIVTKVVSDFSGGTSITFKLSEGDTQTGSYYDITSSAITVPAADLRAGKVIGWRIMPSGVSKRWIKMVAAPTGTFTTGSVFAAVVREEEQPYEDGMYIDAGIVKG